MGTMGSEHRIESDPEGNLSPVICCEVAALAGDYLQRYFWKRGKSDAERLETIRRSLAPSGRGRYCSCAERCGLRCEADKRSDGTERVRTVQPNTDHRHETRGQEALCLQQQQAGVAGQVADGGTKGRSQEVSRDGTVGRVPEGQSGCLEVHEEVQHQGHGPVREGVQSVAPVDGSASKSRCLYVGPFSGVPKVWVEETGGSWYAVAPAWDVSKISMSVL